MSWSTCPPPYEVHACWLRGVPCRRAEQEHSQNQVPLRKSLVFIHLFIYWFSKYLFTACSVPGTMDTQQWGRQRGQCPPKSQSLIRCQSPVVRKERLSQYFSEVMINCCMTIGRLSHSTTPKFVCSEAGFSGPLRITGFQSWEALTGQLMRKQGPRSDTLCPLTRDHPEANLPAAPLSPQMKLKMAYSLGGIEIRRPSKEVSSILNFSGRWLCKMHTRQLMRQGPKLYLDLTRGFSTIQKPGNEESRGPATRNLPLEPPVCLLINLP